MKTACSQTYRLMIILTIVVGMLSGCASVFQDLEDKIQRRRFKYDFAAYEKALAVYAQGDFEKAGAQFKALSTVSDSQPIARKAWLGAICCRLMLADTQAEFTAAIGMWDDFTKSAPGNDAVWDMALLDPLIFRLAPKNTPRMRRIHPPAQLKPAVSAAPADRQQDKQQLEAELAALKKKAEQAEQLQLRMDEIMAENRSLKDKIKALEAIDQNIQKKKTKISAPSE